MENVKRVGAMESILNRQSQLQEELKRALDAFEAENEAYCRLRDYYGSEAMDEDLEAEREGKLDEVSRGVLTEDAVYDLMGDRYELGLEMLRVAHMALKHY